MIDGDVPTSVVWEGSGAQNRKKYLKKIGGLGVNAVFPRGSTSNDW